MLKVADNEEGYTLLAANTLDLELFVCHGEVSLLLLVFRLISFDLLCKNPMTCF